MATVCRRSWLDRVAIAALRSQGVVAVVAALALSVPSVAHAQKAVFAGTVMVDPTEQRLANAEIVFTSLNRSTRSDSAGNFSITGLPAGKYSVTVRMVGFDPFTTDITLNVSQKIEADMLLKPSTQISVLQQAMMLQAGASQTGMPLAGAPNAEALQAGTKLSAVAISEKRETPFSARLAGFEERRKSGAGRFITADEFAKESGRPLSAIVAKHISGVKIQQVNGRRYLAGGRQGELRMNGTVMKGGSTPGADQSSLDQPRGCYLQVVLDGVMVYNGTSGQPLFDIDQLESKSIVGFEVHTAATLPAQYNSTQSADAGSCGTAIIWTKAG